MKFLTHLWRGSENRYQTEWHSSNLNSFTSKFVTLENQQVLLNSPVGGHLWNQFKYPCIEESCLPKGGRLRLCSHYTGLLFVPTRIAVLYSVNTPIQNVTLNFRDRRGAASLRYRNSTEITVLMCEQMSYPVWFRAVAKTRELKEKAFLNDAC